MIREIHHCDKVDEKYKVLFYPKHQILTGYMGSLPMLVSMEEHYLANKIEVLTLLSQFDRTDCEYIVMDLKENREVLSKDYTGIIHQTWEGGDVA